MNAVAGRHDWTEAEHVIRGLSQDAGILLVCHVNPDGDALGSMLGFGLGLRGLGYQRIAASFPGPLELPEPLRDLPGLELLVAEDAVPFRPDVVVAFDAASIARLGKLADSFSAAETTIVLDHHASNTRFGKINLIDPTAAATAMIVETLLVRLGVVLNADIAECLYVALTTDTGSFRFNATPDAHRLAARLIATGIPAGVIAQKLFDTRPFGAVRLFGAVLQRAILEPTWAGGRGLV
ncbi:MAG: DHH family phosphoesterase, partial [Micromonosporaceae bacterium]|nr:DHH family phosphoesterase [Micromonosporaceae bacterium]